MAKRATKKEVTITKPSVLKKVNEKLIDLGLPKVKSLTVTTDLVCPPGYVVDWMVGDNGLEEYCRKL